jgi:hypothetical protein
MSKAPWILAAMLGAALAFPAGAQITNGGVAKNEAECQAQFQHSDRNGDGLLGPREISAVRGSIPTELSGRDVIYRQDFMSACYATVPERE